MAIPDLSRIRLLVLDVDGILTDGGLYVFDDGTASKRFCIIDGAGLVYWMRSGLEVAIVSGHASEAVQARFKALGVKEVHTGVGDKLAVFTDLLARLRCTPEETAVMGDDLMDLSMMRRAGFAATVRTAHDEVLRVAHYVTTKAAGSGAVREVVELVLRARGLFDAILERYRS